MKIRRLVVLSFVLMLTISMITPTAQAQDDAIVILYPQELDSLNPMYTSMFFAAITQDLYLSGAWTFDADLQPLPVLVTEIPSVENGGLSEDGRTITLNIREDAVWSDGTPLTSADFVFTYEAYRNTDNLQNVTYPYGEADNIISSVEAPDEFTVVVNFVEPFAPWLATLFTRVLPAHVLAPVFEAEGTLIDAAWNRDASVSAGPYVLAEWQTGAFMRFVANENYFGDTPKIPTVIIRFIPEDDVLLATLLQGEADAATFIDYSDVPALEAAGLEHQIVSSGYNEHWTVNLREGLAHPAMLDVRVREAIALATDREGFTENALLGMTYPAAGFWEGSPYASPNVSAPPYDPARANELLDEAGWIDSNGDGTRDKDGIELVLRYITNQRGIRVDAQAVFQQQLAEVGIGVELINYPSDVYFNNFANGGPMAIGDFDLAQLSQTSNFPDPAMTIFRCNQIPSEDSPDGNNYRGYCNEEVEQLFIQSEITTDYDARVAIFHKIDEILASEFVYIGIWYDPDLWVVSNTLVNADVNGVSPYWNIANWERSSSN
jgi:peptide/nickel transport system substrate-binding protein